MAKYKKGKRCPDCEEGIFQLVSYTKKQGRVQYQDKYLEFQKKQELVLSPECLGRKF